MKNEFKKNFSALLHRRIKIEKKPLTVLTLWHTELIVAAIIFCVAIFIDVWIYQKMVSGGVAISSESIGQIEILNKKDIINGALKANKHKDLLENPTFPLTGNPF